MKYYRESRELRTLLAEDQKDKRQEGRDYFSSSSRPQVSRRNRASRRRSELRAIQLSALIDTVAQPRLSYVGRTGVVAIAVLAMHADEPTLYRVTRLFEALAIADPMDTDQTLLPALLDWQAVLKHQPQKFGTIWLFNKNRRPYLYQTSYVEEVDARRARYGLKPLDWPRSLAIPESEQPWLRQPIQSREMRWPTPEEWQELVPNTQEDAPGSAAA